MRKYSSYKDSGIDWIGEIPEPWDVLKVGRIMYLGRGRVISNIEIQDNLGEYPVYSSQTSNKGILGFINTYDFEGDYITWTTDGANAGTVFFRTGKFNCTNVCGTMKPKINTIYLPYFAYLLNLGTEYYVRYDINPKLMNAEMSEIPICYTIFEEQQAIANFLDRKASQIDTLVDKKQRQIELLKEQRQAVINQAVTKGLDPNVEMKDSGIEWLGEIPEHWEDVAISRVVDPKRKITYGIVQPGELCPDGIFMVRGQDYSNGWAEPEKIFKVSPEIEAPYKRSRLLSGDILITIVGAGLGNTAIVPDWLNQANITQTTARIAINPDKGTHKFYKYVLESKIGKYNVKIYAKGAAQPGLNLEHVAIFRVPLLPLDEQDSIVKYLDNKINEIDNIISKTKKQIQLLQEYRTALISEAVTGKIDVREH